MLQPRSHTWLAWATLERCSAAEQTPIDVESGRLLNCAVTRSFGDNRWKWSIEALNRWQSAYFGRNCLSNYHSPPYITARPVVTSTKTRPGDFVILASDGFWNHMVSSEDAVHCAGMWIDAQSSQGGGDAVTNQPSKPQGPPSLVSDHQEEKPVDTKSRDGGHSPAGFPYNWTVQRDHFVVEEDNIATHLVKNAFGGNQRDLFCSVLSTTAPDSKEARDDTTVLVILL
ncbi:hypothetical protein F5144DRAFT_519130 [Chaetomium tenue]|uniref:Uncharacterized protein n=1 Tax=Chaetomium tenue TaxID=1854479 RepID=A0ACB7P516_9PEZI|nr:hypothetical protein F5144DRAFT_519130 [Chaetomium globosum]